MVRTKRWITLGMAAMGVGFATPQTAAPAASDAKGDPGATARLIHEFRQLWHGAPSRVRSNRYLGIETLQNPLDVWVTQEILFEVKPQLVVETGTYRGGSALLWATLLAPIDADARVLTIDWKDLRSPQAIAHPLFASHVTFLRGSSTDPAIVARVAERAKGLRTVFILDSDHREQHVLAELRAYAPLVSAGSYLIVQDTPLGGGAAIQRFLEENDRFEIDRTRERFILSNNLTGFLKRVK